MRPVIKWPGGKTREVDKIRHLIPKYDRYIEPFFGGGAVFFDLMPEKAVINDISSSLMLFYKMIKEQNVEFKDILLKYNTSFQSLINTTDELYGKVLGIYQQEYVEVNLDEDIKENKQANIQELVDLILNASQLSDDLVLDYSKYRKTILKNVSDKFRRTSLNNSKRRFSDEDLKENLITGFTSGFYMYFRDVYNDINLSRISVSDPYNIANFYFIREYCYGSMFRYNKNGEFNIPYGGMSYNRKQFIRKIEALFNKDIKTLFENVSIYNSDFEEFLYNIEPKSNDFMFLDPPYDTDFSDYEGVSFDLEDQTRLAKTLKNIPAKFILIIKDTDFIYNLYKDDFLILSFDKNYTYNVRSRNDRKVTHLIITNIDEQDVKELIVSETEI
ncbi:DNA adenine methylase [Aerococcus urinaeequi]|uniref:site-specific DNA-methyltransferase (adenine-specific) n=1 Tax=Aerococcus urinaeequi TaxID=51665 RepID=A0A7M1KTR8_9LACT|nr:DNA adenine methylase [Aerococcus urinaeequi]QOQ79258.1 DNA adenine methylase [Aerococcus urinaeequi]